MLDFGIGRLATLKKFRYKIKKVVRCLKSQEIYHIFQISSKESSRNLKPSWKMPIKLPRDRKVDRDTHT